MSDGNDLSGFLSDKDRILRAAWALPNEGTLEDPLRRAAIKNFAEYCARHGVTFAQVAHELGKPREGVIRELVRGVYRETADESIRALNGWVEAHARRQVAKPAHVFVQTKVAKDIQNVAHLILDRPMFGACIGASGIGKTRCAEVLAETIPGAIYIRVTFDRRRPRGFIAALADILNCRKTQGRQPGSESAGTVLGRCLDRLKDSNRLLIVDEAHNLTLDGGLEVLRDIHDVAGIPILLLATKDLQDTLIRSADADHGQIYSRVGCWVHLHAGHDLYSGDRRPLFTKDDIRRLYEQPPLRLADDGVSYLQSIANMLGHGSLRRCQNLIDAAARRARVRQGLGEFDEVLVTAEDLGHAERILRSDPTEKEFTNERRRRAATLAEA